jgi:prepilin-type N-terminal cleavage/methylation domain-containing protein
MQLRQQRYFAPSGFTTIELMITLVIAGVVAAFGYPSIAQQLRHTRVNQASQIVAADLELASSIAAKEQRPMIFEGRATEYLVRDRASGAVRFRRMLGGRSEWGISSLVYEPTSLELYPTGSASAPLIVRLASLNYSRTVTMSRAGLVRVVP